MDPDLKSLNKWLDDFTHEALTPEERRKKPKTMQLLCNEFKNPERFAPCFHVSGSKGKGTISAGISAILTEAGYKTGLLVSPHVVHFSERITLNGEPFAPKIYDAAFKELKSGIVRILKENKLEKTEITWDELVTLFAMLVFRQAKVDYAVYEVGLGGRFDPTNVVTPVCVAMGPVELEHTKILGSTRTSIAREKAGTFKTGVPIVSSPQNCDVYGVFRQAAKGKKTSINYVPRGNGDYYKIDMNIARLAVAKGVPSIPRATIRAGAKRTLNLPARFEKIEAPKTYPGLPFLLIDGAHTPESIRAVTLRMKQENISGNLLFGCASDKNVSEIARILKQSELFQKVFLTKPSDYKKSDLALMQTAFSRAGFENLETKEDFKKQIIHALVRSAKEKIPLIVLGSFYLAGEVKKMP
ncbi:bifunctional folylpolyglutamate synthase/dihydrofolate synthase [Candidatus Saccharibacteria bacterium]|nr:bifunctional folylpolyglutamate synthase/dihydrofolate synthase [Candidatus Saccharibacteria bacterium]